MYTVQSKSNKVDIYTIYMYVHLFYLFFFEKNTVMTKILLQRTQMHLRFLLFFQIKYALKIWDVNVHIIIITILDSCSLDFMS